MPSNIAAEATRIAAGDDGRRYDAVEIAFHWATAVFVLGLWLIAQVWEYMPRGSDIRHETQSLHVSLGLIFAAALAGRIVWRIGPGRRPLPATSGLVELASKLVHYALYALLIAQVATGVLWRWGEHDPLGVFGVFVIPSPFSYGKPTAHFFGDIHGTLANVILIVAGLHAAAALFHHYILRDDVLRRMLPRHGRRTAAPGGERTRT